MKWTLNRVGTSYRVGFVVGAWVVCMLVACVEPEMPEPEGDEPSVAGFAVPGDEGPSAALPAPGEPPDVVDDTRRSDPYDPATRRMYLSNSFSGEVLTVDLQAGMLSTLIDQWPWGDPNDFPLSLAIYPQEDRLLSLLMRRVPDPGDPTYMCRTLDVVDIDVPTATPTITHEFWVDCCDDCSPDDFYYQPLVDGPNDTLLLIKQDCDANGCDASNLIERELTTDAWSTSVRFYELDCSTSSDPNCYDNPGREQIKDYVFDPDAPGERVLALMDDDAVVSADRTTGQASLVANVQRTWGQLSLVYLRTLVVDPDGGRLFIVGNLGGGRHAIVALDLATGVQSLLYDGSANAAGDRLQCFKGEAAFDPAGDRLLLRNDPKQPPVECDGALNAIDATTGELRRLAL